VDNIIGVNFKWYVKLNLSSIANPTGV